MNDRTVAQAGAPRADQPIGVPCMAEDTSASNTQMTKEAIAAFFDRLAPQWDHDLIVDEAKINRILDEACVREGATVLDVACGTGVLFPFYIKRNALKVTAVDISPEMIRIARGRMTDARFQIICADIEDLQPTASYDCCVLYNAFPHFPDPARLAERLALWLRPGGRLTIAHGLSIEQINAHHAGSASKVSRGLMPAPALARLLSPLFAVDTEISDDEKYIVSGILRAAKDIDAR